MPYVVKFGYAPGVWKVETGRVHDTRAAAAAEVDLLHSRFSEPEQLQLPRGQARRFAGVGPAYALRIVPVRSRDLPRRLISPPAVVQASVLRKRQ